MKLRKTTVLVLFMAGLMGFSAVPLTVSAQPKTPKERREDRRERRQDRREERRERREDRREARKERREDRRERRKEWRERRQHRRRAARRAFLRRWGPIHKRPVVRAELARHAWRMAQLERMRFLAEEAGKDELVEKIDELKKKEQALHEKRMNAAKAAAEAGSAAPGGDKPEEAAK